MYLGLSILSIGLTIVWHYIVTAIGIDLVIGNDTFVNQHVANLARRQIWQWVEAAVVWVPLQSAVSLCVNLPVLDRLDDDATLVVELLVLLMTRPPSFTAGIMESE